MKKYLCLPLLVALLGFYGLTEQREKNIYSSAGLLIARVHKSGFEQSHDNYTRVFMLATARSITSSVLHRSMLAHRCTPWILPAERLSMWVI